VTPGPDGVQSVEVSRAGEPVRATRFPLASRRELAIGLAALAPAAAGLVLAVSPGLVSEGSRGTVRVLGLAALAFFGATALLWLTVGVRAGSAVILNADGVTLRQGLSADSVPWDAIVRARTAERQGVWHLVLEARGRRPLRIPLARLYCDPGLLVGLVTHMRATACDRSLLADPGGMDVARRFGG
jgi:hypothetical protein